VRGEDAVPVVVHLRVFDDVTEVVTGDDARRWTVGEEFHKSFLRSAHGTITTPSATSSTQWQVHNITTATDLFDADGVTIDVNETQSWTAFLPQNLLRDDDANMLSRGDVLRIDIDTAGGAMGLEVWLELGPQEMYDE
jgi:hypothetical protein